MREPTPPKPTLVTRSFSRLEGTIDAATLQVLTEDLRRATRGSYDVLGLLAVRGRRSLAFLARTEVTGKLVGLRLESMGTPTAEAEEFSVLDQALAEVLPKPPRAACEACHAKGAPDATVCRGCGVQFEPTVKDFATIPLTPELELSIAQNAVADRFVLLGRLSPKFPDWFLARVGRSDRIAALRYRRTPTPGKKEVFEFSLVATYIFVEGPQGTAGNRRASGVRGTAGAGGRTGITPTPTSVPAAKSKVCPQCKRRFDADSRFCSHDRSVLVLEGE